jgi:hypothetical protein
MQVEKKSQRFGGIYRLYLQGQRVSQRRNRRLVFCVVLTFDFEGGEKCPRDVEPSTNLHEVYNLEVECSDEPFSSWTQWTSFPLITHCTRTAELFVMLDFCGCFPSLNVLLFRTGTRYCDFFMD